MNKKKQILIIDDEPFNRKLLKLQLKDAAYNFYETDDFKSAFEILNQNDINLVVCDINLSDFNGIEILKEIRSNFDHIPVIMLSSYNESNYIKKAKDLGCYEYIIKPVEKRIMIEIIKKALEENKLRNDK